MAVSKALLLFTLVAVALFSLVESNEMIVENAAESFIPGQIDCNGACNVRCKLSARPNLCRRACGTCCARCGCVPPGTYGNYEICPCYANMTTHRGQHKCP